MHKFIITAICYCLFFEGFTQTNTSFTPGKLWLDNNNVHINAHGGGILFFDNKYYWFGEHKTEGDKGHLAKFGVHVYSSIDLYNWKDEGIALSTFQDTTKWLNQECIVERPKVIYNKKTKTFVMWFHHELRGKGYSAALTGLASSKTVTGPYTYIKSINPNASIWPTNFADSLKQKQDTLKPNNLKIRTPEGFAAVVNGYLLRLDFNKGQMARDMTLFVDDDGTAYHIHSSERNQTLHIAKLTDDYQDFSETYARALEGKANEAPAIFKVDNKYYLIASGTTGWDPNPARLAVANHPLGVWEELGNPCVGDEKQVKTTFWSQSTFVIPIVGKKNAFIFMGDRWNPNNHSDGRYVWLPILFDNGKPILKWMEEWNLSIFK